LYQIFHDEIQKKHCLDYALKIHDIQEDTEVNSKALERQKE
jgi:hypothetical protein